jgi:hypothetical protein
MVIFSVTGAYCSKWERHKDNLLCFNCNKYGHKQALCTSAPKCVLCSGKHSRLTCLCPTELCCLACNKEGHSVFDWQCRLHLKHWKYTSMQKATATQAVQQALQAKSKTPKPKQAMQAMPCRAASQHGSNTTQGSIEADTNEHKVDMTNTAEISVSNE